MTNIITDTTGTTSEAAHPAWCYGHIHEGTDGLACWSETATLPGLSGHRDPTTLTLGLSQSSEGEPLVWIDTLTKDCDAFTPAQAVDVALALLDAAAMAGDRRAVEVALAASGLTIGKDEQGRWGVQFGPLASDLTQADRESLAAAAQDAFIAAIEEIRARHTTA